MYKQIILTMAMLMTVTLSQVSFAGECKDDKGCKSGEFCIMAVTPHVCKGPQDAGAVCKRPEICKSKKCNKPAGKDVGTCE